MEKTFAVLFYSYILVTFVHVYYRAYKLQKILLKHKLPAPKLPSNPFIFNYVQLAISEGRKGKESENRKELVTVGKWVIFSYILILAPVFIGIANIIING